MVICLQRGADLHMAQLMPLPLTVSCVSKIQIGFTFLARGAHRISFPGGHRRRKGSVVGGGGSMASAEHEPTTGVWGQSPQRGPGAGQWEPP